MVAYSGARGLYGCAAFGGWTPERVPAAELPAAIALSSVGTNVARAVGQG
jgi:hypothetical protein